jgi:hypothetical protein
MLHAPCSVLFYDPSRSRQHVWRNRQADLLAVSAAVQSNFLVRLTLVI